MLDWWQASLFPLRVHEIDSAAAWHGRLMVLAWAVLLPLGVIAARFFKVTPRQKWPEQLDNWAWWRAHLALQYTGGLVLLAALALIWSAGHGGSKWHTWLGRTACALCALQFLSAWLRGSKGGPTNPRPDGSFAGDHYDMTARRRLFERWHKSVGYIALALAILAIASGLWMVNAPRWMPLVLGLWWAALITLWLQLQSQGKAIDTYQAIWGPDPRHPGNVIAPTGWGMRRPSAVAHERDD